MVSSGTAVEPLDEKEGEESAMMKMKNSVLTDGADPIDCAAGEKRKTSLRKI